MTTTAKVLIVDDNEYVRRKLRRILSPNNCDLFEAETEDDALALIAEHAFQVIFLDIRLPFGATGIDVFRRAKQLRPDLGNVIILTGWLEDATRSEALSLGAYAWLDKAPFDRKKIIELFREALSKAGS